PRRRGRSGGRMPAPARGAASRPVRGARARGSPLVSTSPTSCEAATGKIGEKIIGGPISFRGVVRFMVEDVGGAAARNVRRKIMNWTLELIVVPVTDIDRAKAFYVDRVGFDVHVDHRAGDFRVVQLDPKGSGCSIAMVAGGPSTPSMEPGSLQ